MSDTVLKDIEKPFLPLLISNWIFGIGIIEYPIRKPQRFISFIYTLFILTVFGFIAYNAYPAVNYETSVSGRSTGPRILFAINISVTFVILISGWFQKKGLRKCFLKAALVNTLMQKIGIPKNHSKILKYELLKLGGFFFFILTIMIINFFLEFTEDDFGLSDIMLTIVWDFPLIVIFVVDASFINILGYAKFKFNRLNELLESLLTSTPDNPLHYRLAQQLLNEEYQKNLVVESDLKDYTFLIKISKLAHLRLVKLCREANNTYGQHVLISIGIAFVMILYESFSIYSCITSLCEYEQYKFNAIVRSINWILYYSIKTVSISWFCTSVYKASIKTGHLICELYDEPLISDETKAEIRYFNVELMQNKLEFTAYGVLRIDLSLIELMFTAIGTYFIIIVQFQN